LGVFLFRDRMMQPDVFYPHQARLSDLARHLPDSVQPVFHDVEVSGVALDSRQVRPGYIFVALTGGVTDGHRFIPDALQRGAVAVVGSQVVSDLPVPYFQVSDSRLALAIISAAFYDFPARKLTMIGVTGTDGKTTTCNLVFAILQAAGLRAGMVSTVNAVIGDQVLDTGFHVTTPEAPDVQRYLAQMAGAGLTHVVLEATSHGLAQQRVAACDFDVGVVTNITHEHLDFHGSYESYRSAKGILFRSLAETPRKSFNPPHGAVLNRDDSSYTYLAKIAQVPEVTYGLHAKADVRAQAIHHRYDGLQFIAIGQDAHGQEFRLPVTSRLFGDFNVSNCLAAVAVTLGVLGLDPAAVRQGIAVMKGVPGRMERLDLGQDFTAIVDFAHTPNALRVALLAVRQILKDASEPALAPSGQKTPAAVPGRLIAVFGSAGLRDRLKRRMMAETSAELADLSVFTAEDPRTESLASILEEMAVGAQSRGGIEGQTFWRIPDRREALRFAVALARPGDVVIACGKGHEQSMCFGEVEYAWDDRVALRAALEEHLGLPGPEMPFLPAV
jgi:UDP-N-acetylmuramoyl-L-alanyl-D-glutamate--2,6-diaminopimelate ligase